MGKGFFKVPPAINEPVLSYAPGSAERENVLKAYKSMYNSTIEVPMYINGENIKTGQNENTKYFRVIDRKPIFWFFLNFKICKA